MDDPTYLSNAEPVAIETLYQQYLANPESVDISWKKFFEGFEFAQQEFPMLPGEEKGMSSEFKVINLINAYRSRGHLFTQTNPVRERRKYEPDLNIYQFGLTDADLEKEFEAGKQVDIGRSKLKDIISHLNKVYCQSIGVETAHIRKPERFEWLRSKIHVNDNQPKFTKEEKQHIFKKMVQASGFESFLHTRFPGQKRFSLEGGEALIPALDAVIEHGATLGLEEFVMGMAHRGRLSTLANIFGKDYYKIFSEFVAKDYEEDGFDGDVKYHLGYDRVQTTDSGKEVKLTLCPNPSHLEAVDPVVEGISRARIDQVFDGDLSKVCPILIHGDAAIAAQGIVYEVVQMAGLDGYKVGGTVHIVVNNQVGFTTNYLDARTSTYCTDIAKVTSAPVFHVNGDDVEALVHTMKIAIEYRQKFGGDVFIDLLCYRKYGHNEGDEPKFTQPLLYKAIASHQNPKDIYKAKLESEGTIDAAWAKQMETEFKDKLSDEFDKSKEIVHATVEPFLNEIWKDYRHSKLEDFEASPKTGVSKKVLNEVISKISQLPSDKKFFRKLESIIKQRAKMAEADAFDWSMGELMAYGTLLLEGHGVRISGQDVERGTFSHRHAVLKVEDSEEEFVHLKELSDKQGTFDIYNSLLSEYGVLGYEYGYAMAAPNFLTIWEAQFGDFFNGAQIMIDQFISSAEDKWKLQNGLVMLLPHGFEGMGSEHSSARMERFLSLCSEENMQIVNCTTPASFFHVLRRQLKREFRKPLVVFTPKSLLRHPKCVSTLSDFEKGQFEEVITDNTVKPAEVKQLVFCQGKVYYDLIEKRDELKRKDVAIVRLEQLYPVPMTKIKAEVAKYNKATTINWVQEEPRNMGAWSFLYWKLRELDIEPIARESSASPASGSPKRDALRQEKMLNEVFSVK